MDVEKKIALEHLTKQYRAIAREGSDLYRVEPDDKDMFRWTVWMKGPAETVVEGGVFKTELRFPSDFPNMPPKMRFLTPIFHPNVYEDGRVCISLLHDPGPDPFGYEKAEERWNPARSIESIIVSVISILASPNSDSPANVDAARLLKDNPASYEARLKADVERSIRDLPPGFVPPMGRRSAAAAAPAAAAASSAAAGPSLQDFFDKLIEFEVDIADPENRAKAESVWAVSKGDIDQAMDRFIS